MSVDFLLSAISALERAFGWINKILPLTLELEVTVNAAPHSSQIIIRNSGNNPVILHATDWCIGNEKEHVCFDSVNWDREILPGNTLTINFFPYGRVFQENALRFSKGKNLDTLRFRVHCISGKMRLLHPGEDLVRCLKGITSQDA